MKKDTDARRLYRIYIGLVILGILFYLYGIIFLITNNFMEDFVS